MRHVRVVAYALFGVVALGAVLLGIRIWWASRPPNLPKGWPNRSVWMAGYHPPLSLYRNGAWVSCELDSARGVDRCKFADYEGRIFFQSDYATCSGRQEAVPDKKLLLRNQGSIWLLRLQYGELLFQAPCPRPREVPN